MKNIFIDLLLKESAVPDICIDVAWSNTRYKYKIISKSKLRPIFKVASIAEAWRCKICVETIKTALRYFFAKTKKKNSGKLDR